MGFSRFFTHARAPFGRESFNGHRVASSYTHIVIGAGSAGSVVASRLSEVRENRVLLLEAGGNNQTFMVRSPFLTCPELQNRERYDWAFRSEPQPVQGGRRSYQPRGRCLGGSSSINYMLYVRGDPRNYDAWARECGATGWGYEEVLPFFIKSEQYLRTAPRLADVRGLDGPLGVTDMRDVDFCTKATCERFVTACHEQGLPDNPDYNGPRQLGAGLSQTTIRDGKRDDTASAFLFRTGAIARSNLCVLTHAHVSRIVFQGKRAVGVVLRRGKNTAELRAAPSQFIGCSGEVIVSAGAYQTPQLLMLSGVGPSDELRRHGIPVVHERAGVGRSLKDHLMVLQRWEAREGQTVGFHDKNLGDIARNTWQWLRHNDGIMTTSWVQSMAFFKSQAALQRAREEVGDPHATTAELDARTTVPNDLQIHFVPFIAHDTKQVEATTGLVDHREFAPHGVTFLPSLLLPKGSGYVGLRSSDPFDAPVINPRYLEDERDVQALADAYAFARALGRSPAFSDLLKDDEVIDPDLSQPLHSRAYIEERVRRGAITIYHPSCTARMGPASDPLAVCDPQLRVHGLENVRVADCSVCPEIVSGNTNAPTIMIGERCAAFVMGRDASSSTP